MKRTRIYGVLILVFFALAYVGWRAYEWGRVDPSPKPTSLSDVSAPQATETAPLVEVIAENLTVPWEVLFLPDGELLVTERPGNVVLLTSGTVIPVAGVEHTGEGGLLGAALHPDFAENRLLYLYQTTRTDEGLTNRIVRYRLENQTLTEDRVILDGIPGARYHDGGRIAFGPDGMLYATVGDAGEPALAQDPQTLHGTILRMTQEGDVPEDNPFGNLVYSYGHRNPQGLAWDEVGQLYASEHGRSGVQSGFDEVNRIEKGGNYGWPESEGDTVAPGTIAPLRHSGASVTWAPGGLVYLDGSLYVPGLRGRTLYEIPLMSPDSRPWLEHLANEYGRLRSITLGPDGMFYITTSNRDGRGSPTDAGDRILRVNPEQLRGE